MPHANPSPVTGTVPRCLLQIYPPSQSGASVPPANLSPIAGRCLGATLEPVPRHRAVPRCHTQLCPPSQRGCLGATLKPAPREQVGQAVTQHAGSERQATGRGRLRCFSKTLPGGGGPGGRVPRSRRRWRERGGEGAQRGWGRAGH